MSTILPTAAAGPQPAQPVQPAPPAVPPIAAAGTVVAVENPPPAFAELNVGTIVKGQVSGTDEQGRTLVATDRGSLPLPVQLPEGAEVALQVQSHGTTLQIAVLSATQSGAAPAALEPPPQPPIPAPPAPTPEPAVTVGNPAAPVDPAIVLKPGAVLTAILEQHRVESEPQPTPAPVATASAPPASAAGTTRGNTAPPIPSAGVHDPAERSSGLVSARDLAVLLEAASDAATAAKSQAGAQAARAGAAYQARSTAPSPGADPGNSSAPSSGPDQSAAAALARAAAPASQAAVPGTGGALVQNVLSALGLFTALRETPAKPAQPPTTPTPAEQSPTIAPDETPPSTQPAEARPFSPPTAASTPLPQTAAGAKTAAGPVHQAPATDKAPAASTAAEPEAVSTQATTAETGAAEAAAQPVELPAHPLLALRPGGALLVRVLTLGNGAQSVAPQPGAPILSGVISGVTLSGEPVIDTEDGIITLATRQSPPAGTSISLEVLSLAPKRAATGDAPGSARADSLVQLAHEWPALAEALDALRQANPALAQSMSEHVIARSGAQLAGGLAFFVAALRGGDLKSWIGEERANALERSGRGRLLDKLGHEFKTLSEATDAKTVGGDWRAFFVPVFDGEAIRQLRLFVHKDREHEKEDAETRQPATRFLLDLDLSRLGRFQIDGLVHGKQLDLVIRTKTALPAAMRREINAIFTRACEGSGVAGQIAFQANPRFVEPDPAQLYGHAAEIRA